jgi:hypothetical protein
MRIFWKKLVQELWTHLRQYNNWITETRGVKLGNIALLLDPKKRGLLPLVQITQVQRGLDLRIRQVTVWDGHSEFSRAITNQKQIKHRLARHRPVRRRQAGHRPAGHRPARRRQAGRRPAQSRQAGHRPARHRPARHRPAQWGESCARGRENREPWKYVDR